MKRVLAGIGAIVLLSIAGAMMCLWRGLPLWHAPLAVGAIAITCIIVLLFAWLMDYAADGPFPEK